jgi:C4-dicarboxylate-specific signal transduction histidine kinase
VSVLAAHAARRWLGSQPPNLAETKETLDYIARDVDRAAEIVSRVRQMVTKTPEQKELVSLSEITTDVIAIVQSEAAKHDVSIRTEFTDRSVTVNGHRVELQQVVLNLMMNAIEAMSSNADGIRELVIRTEVLEDRELFVSVRDSGPGLQPEAYERIFKPYYTSKAAGMGMGLSICRMIIEAHGGSIWASANQPHGAVFQFTLPTS